MQQCLVQDSTHECACRILHNCFYGPTQHTQCACRILHNCFYGPTHTHNVLAESCTTASMDQHTHTMCLQNPAQLLLWTNTHTQCACRILHNCFYGPTHTHNVLAESCTTASMDQHTHTMCLQNTAQLLLWTNTHTQCACRFLHKPKLGRILQALCKIVLASEQYISTSPFDMPCKALYTPNIKILKVQIWS